MVTKELLDELAYDARLRLSDEEKKLFAKRLGELLELMESDLARDLSDVEPFSFVHSIKTVLREDIIEPSLDQETALVNAPLAQDGQFLVPRII